MNKLKNIFTRWVQIDYRNSEEDFIVSYAVKRKSLKSFIEVKYSSQMSIKKFQEIASIDKKVVKGMLEDGYLEMGVDYVIINIDYLDN